MNIQPILKEHIDPLIEKNIKHTVDLFIQSNNNYPESNKDFENFYRELSYCYGHESLLFLKGHSLVESVIKEIIQIIAGNDKEIPHFQFRGLFQVLTLLEKQDDQFVKFIKPMINNLTSVRNICAHKKRNVDSYESHIKNMFDLVNNHFNKSLDFKTRSESILNSIASLLGCLYGRYYFYLEVRKSIDHTEKDTIPLSLHLSDAKSKPHELPEPHSHHTDKIPDKTDDDPQPV
jgi:hypothetical protein